MAGVKGRSGGWNRKTDRELKLSGNYRRDRHGKRGKASAEAAKRLDTLRVMLDYHTNQHADGRESLVEAQARIAAGERLNIQPLLRELRQQAATVVQLTSAVERAERESPAEDDDDPGAWLDKWIKRKRNGQEATS